METEVVKQINIAIRHISMYGIDHPAPRSSIDKTYKLLTGVLSKKNLLNLNSTDKRLLVDGKPLEHNDTLAADFNSHLFKHNIAGVRFQDGLTHKEFLLFLKILAARPESVKEKGGIKNILSRIRTAHIKIDETRYTRIGDDQIVTDKGLYEIETTGENFIEIDQEEQIKTETPFEGEILKEIRRLTETGADYQTIFRGLIEKVNEEIETATGELKKEVKTVKFEKKRTESVIRSMSEGLVVVDEKGKVLLMNPAAEKIMETGRDEKVGTGLMQGLKGHHMVSMSRAIEGEDEQKTKDINIAGSEDTQKTIRSSTAVVENEDGKTIGMVSILSDITKQKELDKMKSDFMSKITHELRSPLAAIKQSISVVLEGAAGTLSTSQNKFLSMAKRNIERLSRLVNDILDLSKLESKKMVIERKPEKIVEIAEEVISTFIAWASEKEITLSAQIPLHMPIISLDRDKIIQVLTNLVSNALKFTPAQGRITLSAKTTDDNSFLMVCVNDTGPGIARESLGKVFDKFVQVGDRKVTEIKGTGLGLPIAREIIELHKGKIWAESPVIDERTGKECKGSRFVFTLPV